MLVDLALAIPKRHVRREGFSRPAFQSGSAQRLDHLLAKRLQRRAAILTDQHERALTGLAVKADGAIEHDVEARHSHGRTDLVADPDQFLRWTARETVKETTKKQQRD